jgi:hypothetical protein
VDQQRVVGLADGDDPSAVDSLIRLAVVATAGRREACGTVTGVHVERLRHDRVGPGTRYEPSAEGVPPLAPREHVEASANGIESASRTGTLHETLLETVDRVDGS